MKGGLYETLLCGKNVDFCGHLLSFLWLNLRTSQVLYSFESGKTCFHPQLLVLNMNVMKIIPNAASAESYDDFHLS